MSDTNEQQIAADPSADRDPEPAHPAHIRFEIGEIADVVNWVKAWTAWFARNPAPPFAEPPGNEPV
jgi:hypothetical protein